MNKKTKQVLAGFSATALAAVIATSALAAPAQAQLPQTEFARIPVPIAAAVGWELHWALQDLELLRLNKNLPPEALVSAVDPNATAPLSVVAEVMLHMYGFGGEDGAALDRAVELGLIRATDFDGKVPEASQPASREQLALWLTRALGMNGADDPASNMKTAFTDDYSIQDRFRPAVARIQAAEIMVGDGTGRFSPQAAVTMAEAVRIVNNAHAWQARQVDSITGLQLAEATYELDGQQVTLQDGVSVQPAAPGSAMSTTVRLSDRLAAGDVTGDGLPDAAVVLTVDGGGSGTFFYLAVVQHDGTPVKAAFLGDRIKVQDVRIVSGEVVVDMLTRAEEDPMTARPHVKETRTFTVQDGALVPADA